MSLKLQELRDDAAGTTLTAEPPDTTTSQQSGSTFCYEKDFDVFADDGRYERWIDLYPDVNLRICNPATGGFAFIAPGDGELFTRVQLPVGLGGLPNLRIPDDEDDEDYIPKSITIAIYDFEVGLTDPVGYINSLLKEVQFSDIFERHDGTTFMADSYTIRYETAYAFGNAPLHSLVASVHPRREVQFLDLDPSIAPSNDYTWYNYRQQSLRVSGTGGHYPLERDTAGEYAGHGSGPLGWGLGYAAGRRRHFFSRHLGGAGSALLDRNLRRFASRLSPFLGGGLFGVAHVGANYLNASSGYLLGNVTVTPEGGTQPATIQIAVGVNLEDDGDGS